MVDGEPTRYALRKLAGAFKRGNNDTVGDLHLRYFAALSTMTMPQIPISQHPSLSV
jgi:hypothetical protein